ncbi:MAG: NADH-quinone oxidoreductase subunit NuoF, partial [Actinomycetota bacterium]
MSTSTPTTLTPVLSAFWDDERSWSMDTYEANEGYQALRKALVTPPAELIETVKSSGLRGRGGAGFPTGMKWGFLPKPDGGPRYLVVNADESEPGTCKDTPLMMAAPQFLIEGVVITSYAIGCDHAFIYVRGEVVHVYRRLLRAVEEAYERGYLGKNILGSGFDLDVTVHAGAGAYICGEETALLDSLEGRRGQPRLKPPFPAVAGLYARPTVVNNVESIASVPPIVLHGADWFTSMGTEKSTGFGLFSLSGHVTRPGQYEAPLGITLRELLEMAGGMRNGAKLKFWTPGGSSTPIFTDAHLDVPLDFESVAAAGSMLGTRALQIFDESVSVVRAVSRWIDFYAH